MRHSLLSMSFAGFQSSTVSLTATAYQHQEEKELKLHILDPADDCSSLASSNRSSIRSDTSLMVKDSPYYIRTSIVCSAVVRVDKG